MPRAVFRMPRAVFRPMTDVERELAIALGSCSFTPGCFDKMFARNLAARARSEKPEITEKQAALLPTKVHTYRRQIHAKVLALLPRKEA